MLLPADDLISVEDQQTRRERARQNVSISLLQCFLKLGSMSSKTSEFDEFQFIILEIHESEIITKSQKAATSCLRNSRELQRASGQGCNLMASFTIIITEALGQRRRLEDGYWCGAHERISCPTNLLCPMTDELKASDNKHTPETTPPPPAHQTITQSSAEIQDPLSRSFIVFNAQPPSAIGHK